MTSSATLVTAPPEKRDFRFFGIKPEYRPVEDEVVGTQVEGNIGQQIPRIRALDRAYAAWNSLDDNTVISIDWPLAGFFKLLDGVSLRQPRIPSRYSDAAQELRSLLPSVNLETLALMCGVSDTAYRNWLKGKGIREKQLRRLLANRSLARALVIQRGHAAADEWMQKPHPQLDGQSPVEAICDGRIDDVLPLAVEWWSPRRRSIIPSVEDTDEILDANEEAAARQLAPTEVYTVF